MNGQELLTRKGDVARRRDLDERVIRVLLVHDTNRDEVLA